MREGWRFDTEEVFDDDYLDLYADVLTDEVSDAQTERVWQLLDLRTGDEILDLACGHGRIANRLAARGARVTGLDVTPRFLEVAREDATARGVEVDYVEGDMRTLPWDERFDAVLSVFTSFGYFDDDDNRRVLREIRRVLRPGGALLLDVNHLPWLLANFRSEVVVEHDGTWMIDRNRYEPLLGRSINERTVIRDGAPRTFGFSIRLFTFTELRDWLLGVGFRTVEGLGGRGDELTLQEPRMVVRART